MAIMKYKDSLEDLLQWFDGEWVLPTTTYAYRGKWYDPEKFDLVPKREFRQELIVQKEKELQKLEERKKALEEDIKNLNTG